MDKNFFKKRIKALRKINNLTQSQLADVLGLSLSAYAELEEDVDAEPTEEIVTKLSKIYLVSISDLIGTEKFEHNETTCECSDTEIAKKFNIFLAIEIILHNAYKFFFGITHTVFLHFFDSVFYGVYGTKQRLGYFFVRCVFGKHF